MSLPFRRPQLGYPRNAAIQTIVFAAGHGGTTKQNGSSRADASNSELGSVHYDPGSLWGALQLGGIQAIRSTRKQCCRNCPCQTKRDESEPDRIEACLSCQLERNVNFNAFYVAKPPMTREILSCLTGTLLPGKDLVSFVIAQLKKAGSG